MAPARATAEPGRFLVAARSAAAGAALGAAGARIAYRLLIRPPQRGSVDGVFSVTEHSRDVWRRADRRGGQVTLLEGPALAFGICAGAALAPRAPRRLRAATMLATAGAAAFGACGDLSGGTGARGVGGLLSAMAGGRVTAEAVKFGGIAATGVAAGAVLRRSAAGALLDGALITASATLFDLLGARPGRAAKAALIAGTPLLAGRAPAVAASVLGAASALLAEDLTERAALGDLGAAALGAALGTTAAAALPPAGRAAALAAVAALAAAVEPGGDSAPAAVPPLRGLDEPDRTVQAPGPVPVLTESPEDAHAT